MRAKAMESFARESFFYLLVGGGIQGAVAIVASPAFFSLARYCTKAPVGRLLAGYLVFNGFLLIWGCLGHYLFLSLTLGKLYISMDRMVDWHPMIPFGQWVLNQTLNGPRGYLIGDATLGQLRLIWAAVAVPVWLLAYASTKLVLR